jgi:hypothetical protein
MMHEIYEMPIPQHMCGLPRDLRNRPVPWFAWRDDDGVAHVTILDQEKWHHAVHDNLCWICGCPLDCLKTFVLGPINVITRTTTEPPSHPGCAKYAMCGCPFLSNPARGRKPVPERYIEPDPVIGHDGRRPAPNPGIFALWTTRSYELGLLRNQLAIIIGDPVHVAWWTRGRRATGAELQAAQAVARGFFPEQGKAGEPLQLGANDSLSS